MRFRTTVVGSYPQPDWLVWQEKLRVAVPRVHAREIWRVGGDEIAQAQDTAALMAIGDMERAGIDVITDGEVRRESYSNHFVSRLEGMDLARPGTAVDRTGRRVAVPAVRGPVRRVDSVELDALRFLKAHTNRAVKVTLPGPFTMTQQAENLYYETDEALAFDLAKAVNEEARELLNAGADVVQIDEPYLQARPERAKVYAIEAVNRAVSGLDGTTALHICFGYGKLVKDKPRAYEFLSELDRSDVDQISLEAAQPQIDLAVLETLAHKTIVLGLLDLSTHRVEKPEEIASRVRVALRHVDAARLILAPDCGMKFLPRDVAFAKLSSLVEAAEILSIEYAQSARCRRHR
jgi:5-methyltetrahydropteroyltriglutamate--homocysteine methyltransferase